MRECVCDSSFYNTYGQLCSEVCHESHNPNLTDIFDVHDVFDYMNVHNSNLTY